MCYVYGEVNRQDADLLKNQSEKIEKVVDNRVGVWYSNGACEKTCSKQSIRSHLTAIGLVSVNYLIKSQETSVSR